MAKLTNFQFNIMTLMQLRETVLDMNLPLDIRTDALDEYLERRYNEGDENGYWNGYHSAREGA